ncbi:MAG TPA: GH25 family lysozyme [Dehalococcoidia bacterium]|nr:GH25 family lysozyme [Dehalococcoidia bacterium]
MSVVVLQQQAAMDTVPAVVEAVDISNWTGRLSGATLGAWRQAGVRLVVRLSLESTLHRAIALQQLRAASEAGFAVAGYGWCYWQTDPTSNADSWCDLAHASATPLRMIWLDAEDDPAGADVVGWLRRAAQRIEARGYRAGVYARQSWWWMVTGDSQALSDLPLWAVQWDGRATLDDVRPFGGWSAERIVGKQYAGDVRLGGVAVDRNVFRSGSW